MEPLKVLYEDNHIIIVLKEPNELVQGDDTGDATLLSRVKEYVRVTYNKPGEAYIGLVHRLDRPVGGVMCFARTSKAASRLSEQLRTHEMRRTICMPRARKRSFTGIRSSAGKAPPWWPFGSRPGVPIRSGSR